MTPLMEDRPADTHPSTQPSPALIPTSTDPHLSNRLKGGLNYSEYQKSENLQAIQKRALQVNQPVASEDNLLRDLHAIDDAFYAELDALVKPLVMSIAELKRLYEGHLKDEYVNAASAINMRADALVQTIQTYGLVADFPGGVEVEEGDVRRMEEGRYLLPGLVLPCMWKAVVAQGIAEFSGATAHILTKAQIAGGVW